MDDQFTATIHLLTVGCFLNWILFFPCLEDKFCETSWWTCVWVSYSQVNWCNKASRSYSCPSFWFVCK